VSSRSDTRVLDLIDSSLSLIISDGYTRPISDLDKWDGYISRLSKAVNVRVKSNPRKAVVQTLLISLKQESVGRNMKSILGNMRRYIIDDKDTEG
jgi:hypothetical protein